MEQNTSLKPIGRICVDDDDFRIELSLEYRDALVGLEGFSHINVLWWFSACDHSADRSHIREEKPYTKGPDALGVFATRSPRRPNPIALSCACVTYLDAENGVIGLAYIDADDQSPLLDIKPYTPSLDRVDRPNVPVWCQHWPEQVETSGAFDWSSEFNF